MENNGIDGKLINLNLLPVEELNTILDKLDTEELTVKQEINSILAKLA